MSTVPAYLFAATIALAFVLSATALTYCGSQRETLRYRIPTHGTTPRPRFAAELDHRYQQRGQGLRVGVDARDDRTLQLRWPGQPDPNHLSRLQSSEGFHRALRARGFVRLEAYSGAKRIWTKPL